MLPYNKSISKHFEKGLKNIFEKHEEDLKKLKLKKINFKPVYHSLKYQMKVSEIEYNI